LGVYKRMEWNEIGRSYKNGMEYGFGVYKRSGKE
jgi:hypothetical protein